MKRWSRLAVTLALTWAALGTALGADSPPRVVTFARGLVHPWSLAFLPDGSLLVTERPGRLRRVSADGTSLSPPIAGVPAVDAAGQGGLFEVLPADQEFATGVVY